MADSLGAMLAIGIVGPFLGAGAAFLAARVTAQPASDQVVINRFQALADLQEKERKKLEKVAGELEIMVIRLIEWADEVTVIVGRRNVKIPPRPKFSQMNGRNGTS